MSITRRLTAFGSPARCWVHHPRHCQLPVPSTCRVLELLDQRIGVVLVEIDGLSFHVGSHIMLEAWHIGVVGSTRDIVDALFPLVIAHRPHETALIARQPG